jgi:hypothetical protein
MCGLPWVERTSRDRVGAAADVARPLGDAMRATRVSGARATRTRVTWNDARVAGAIVRDASTGRVLSIMRAAGGEVTGARGDLEVIAQRRRALPHRKNSPVTRAVTAHGAPHPRRTAQHRYVTRRARASQYDARTSPTAHEHHDTTHHSFANGASRHVCDSVRHGASAEHRASFPVDTLVCHLSRHNVSRSARNADPARSSPLGWVVVHAYVTRTLQLAPAQHRTLVSCVNHPALGTPRHPSHVRAERARRARGLRRRWTDRTDRAADAARHADAVSRADAAGASPDHRARSRCASTACPRGTAHDHSALRCLRARGARGSYGRFAAAW